MSIRRFIPALACAALIAVPVTAQHAPPDPNDTRATFPATPHASKVFAWPTGIPYQADTEPELIRGPQSGYNLCNSTTEGQDSLCQTGFFNSIDDFCIWAPPHPDSVIGDTEGEGVAWCTKPGHGGRLIPEGALTGLQFMKTPAYIQIVGFLDQTKVNIQSGDGGGEFDPHGADVRGNPLGGLMYSNAFSGGGENYQQVIEWSLFIGADAFCFKVCDPAMEDDDHFCEHIYDRMGCTYNMPNQAQNGVFEACLGENQDYPGTYVENGQTLTYTQPAYPTLVEPTYTPRIPGSSSCETFQSAELFAALASVSAPGAETTPAPSDGEDADASGAPTTTGGNPRPTTTPAGGNEAAAGEGEDSSAMTFAASGITIFAVLFATTFFA
ncbi:hypothetical protein BDV98DRAFT_512086 [Pterulicium gracile]|uniref:Macrofage activating glycoprotein n=1 Tax=Pterulicium gracile TaxID=1884261 RepID=A0A5C3Q976_9AGAR|nr:hypothetical protein BDV98DRAFT_512086 [Pterula gracilis]